MSEPNILLIEDDEVDILNIKRALKANNLSNNLQIARNGLEGLELIQDKSIPDPKVILLDINMPKMNGIEFLQELRQMEKYKQLPVFIMTTSNDDNDKYDAYNLNVAGYILKPLSFDKFVEAVKKLSDYWKIIEFPRT